MATIDPGLEAELNDLIARLQTEKSRLQEAIVQKQGNIDGTAGAPPGLQASDDVNKDIYEAIGEDTAYFEDERRALDGVYAGATVEEDDFEDGATRTGIFFPGSNQTIYPSDLPRLRGQGSTDPVNENAEKAKELAAIATLLTVLPVINRPGHVSYTDWKDSLTAQKALLGTQITAATNNPTYGAGHPDVVAAQAELDAINALYPDPPNPASDDLTLTTRQAQATARKAFIPTRVATLDSDVTSIYDGRYVIVRARIDYSKGTLTILRYTEEIISRLQTEDIPFIDTQIALYQSMLP